jgi:Flp pilus assembly protein TadB
MTVSPSPGEHPTSAPPVGEEIHIPRPTILPLVTAIAITLIVIGTTLSWIVSIVGLVILVATVIRWIGDTRRDVAALPGEHR